jgi:hypothetical protein
VNGAQLAQMFAAVRGGPAIIDHVHTGLSIAVNPGRYGASIVRRIDGRATFGEIFDAVRAEAADSTPPTDARLFEDFREIYEALNGIDRLLLRRHR